MHWFEPVAWFFSGAFLANFVPHFVQGISGNRFPTPFAKPPGKGLSSPIVNTVWSRWSIYLPARCSSMPERLQTTAGLLFSFSSQQSPC